MRLKGLLTLLVVSLCLTACDPNKPASDTKIDHGFFVSYSIGFLEFSINQHGEVSISAAPEFQLPTPLGTVRAGYYVNAAQELNVQNTLTVRYNGTDTVYDMHGQTLPIRLPPGYYDEIEIYYERDNLVINIRTTSGGGGETGGGGIGSGGSSGGTSFHCSNAYGPSFTIGDRFVVPFGDGPSGLYTYPNEEPRLASVFEGTGGTIIGGPVCKIGTRGINNDGTGTLIVWEVQTDAGLQGWMAEGYHGSVVPWIVPDNG